MTSVTTIQALGDNFIFLCEYENGKAFVVDPGSSAPVLDVIQKRGLKVTEILVTHHHWDHTGAVAELKHKTGCRVIGSDRQRIPGADCIVSDGEVLTIGDTHVQVIATPGHTRTSVCYYAQPSNNNQSGILWTGDTLFTGGCGRLLECDAQSMWQSLQKLASLPGGTPVYCGHDYAVENYEFALKIEPNNPAVMRRLAELKQAQNQGRQTVPSTMLQEKITNPFLRADAAGLRSALGMADAAVVDVFAELRRRKDIF